MCQQCKYKDATIEAQRRSIVALSYELAEAKGRIDIAKAIVKKQTEILERLDGWMKDKEEAA